MCPGPDPHGGSAQRAWRRETIVLFSAQRDAGMAPVHSTDTA